MTKQIFEECGTCEAFDRMVQIGTEILLQPTIEGILQASHSHIHRLFDIPLMAIGFYNEESSHLDFIGHHYIQSRIITGSLPLYDTQIWAVRCFTNSEEIIISHVEEPSELRFSKILFKEDDALRKSFLYIPLRVKNITIGILTLQSFKENEFSGTEVNFIRSITNYISIAVENVVNIKKLHHKHNDLEAIIENMEDLIHTRTYELEQKKNELERLSIVAQKTENAIMIMDEFGNIEWINDFFTNIYGYSLTTFLKIRGTNILQTSFNPHIKELFEQCIRTKKAVYYQALNIKFNGEHIWTQTSLTPVLDSCRNITHLVTIDSDITAIKKAEQLVLEKNKEIVQSIEYASTIQRAAFPSIEYIERVLPQHFILWKPRDIVSGDFYWVKQKEDITIVVVGDCTGHGVPGALLSMMGCSFLDEICAEYTIESASDIIDKMQKLFELRFRQKVMGKEIADGMDIGVYIINKKNQTVSFSGANHDLICVNKSLQHIRGNRMCVGGNKTDDYTFTNITLPIESDTTYYMFTDGYHSQFGGLQEKKFMKKNLIFLFEKMRTYELIEQKKILSTTLEIWMQDFDQQIDDILIVGFRI